MFDNYLYQKSFLINEEIKPAKNLTEAANNADNIFSTEKINLYNTLIYDSISRYKNIFYCDYFMIEFNSYSSNTNIMTIYYCNNFDKLEENCFSLNLSFDRNEYFKKIERAKHARNVKIKNVNFNKYENISLFNLLNEACVCLKNQCYFAFLCITRNFIFEAANLYHIPLENPANPEDISFKNIIKPLKTKNIFTKEDAKLWTLIIETCDRIVHYKEKVNNEQIKLCCKGIKSLFDLIDKLNNLKRNKNEC